MVASKDYNSIDWCSLVYYDPESETGLRWKEAGMCGRYHNVCIAKAGDVAGHLHTNKITGVSRAYVGYKYSTWFTHRIIWIMHNSYLDNNYTIDHIDGDSSNNHISNLRAVETIINSRNVSKMRDNTGVSGVVFTVKNSNALVSHL